jgi:carbonic anhydrase
MMRLIEEQSPKLSEMKRKGEIDIVGGLYDVETGSMEYLEADS